MLAMLRSLTINALRLDRIGRSPRASLHFAHDMKGLLRMISNKVWGMTKNRCQDKCAGSLDEFVPGTTAITFDNRA